MHAGLVLDALGDDRQIHAVRQLHRSFDDRLVVRIFHQRHDERLVYLEFMQRDIAQLCERRVPRAKIIDRQLYAHFT